MFIKCVRDASKRAVRTWCAASGNPVKPPDIHAIHNTLTNNELAVMDIVFNASTRSATKVLHFLFSLLLSWFVLISRTRKGIACVLVALSGKN